MFEVTGINLADDIKQLRTSRTLSYPSDITLARWGELVFDLNLSAEIVFRDRKIARHILENPNEAQPQVNHGASSQIDIVLSNLFFHDYLQLKSLDEKLREYKSNRVRVLSAHGGDEGIIFRRWYYHEMDEPIEPVQKWIDRYSNDKLYGALIIGCCNHGKRNPKFRGVPIYYFKGAGCNCLDSSSHLADY